MPWNGGGESEHRTKIQPKMTMRVRVINADTAGEITVQVDRPGNSTCRGYEIDPIDQPARYFIAFYTEGDDSAGMTTDTYRTGVADIPGQPVSTSFTGLVVVDAVVVARDRRQVRDGRITEQ